MLEEAEEDLFVSSLDGADEGVSPPRSSSRLSPRARHSSTSADVVAVNRSDILSQNNNNDSEGRKEGGRLEVMMRKKAKMKMKKDEKKKE
mgnify:CR=1 FL=1